MASDEASKESEFLSAFINASLESLDHKTIKDEQIECFHRIVWLGRYVLAVLPTGFGKSAIDQLFPKVLFHTPHQKPPFFFVGLQRETVP